jgi:hypothetical protein
MIVQHAVNPVRRLARGRDQLSWRCIVRRGMLYSECESVDHILLPPFGSTAHELRDGTEEAVYVVAGSGVLTDDVGSHELARQCLALIPAKAGAEISAGPAGLELVMIRVLPRSLSGVLPGRRPELGEAERRVLANPGIDP